MATAPIAITEAARIAGGSHYWGGGATPAHDCVAVFAAQGIDR